MVAEPWAQLQGSLGSVWLQGHPRAQYSHGGHLRTWHNCKGHPRAQHKHMDTLSRTSCERPKGRDLDVWVPEGDSTVPPTQRRARRPAPIPHLAVDTVGVVALGALGAGEEVALSPAPEAAAHHTHVLGREAVRGGRGGTESVLPHLSVHPTSLVTCMSTNLSVLEKRTTVFCIVSSSSSSSSLLGELSTSASWGSEQWGQHQGPPPSVQFLGGTSHSVVLNWAGGQLHTSPMLAG